jgi:hypothetical protein
MPTLKHIPVQDLRLDLANYRTIPQKDEISAIHAMITMDATHFWGLMESLIDDGFTPTENLIVITTPKNEFVVKEGNRRASVMKLCLGMLPTVDMDVPQALQAKLDELSPDWKANNTSIPCVVFSAGEEKDVQKIVSRVHAKLDPASRVKWESIAKARFNRDIGEQEPGLDLFDKFLSHSKDLTQTQAQKWAGDYPITVLDAAIQKLAPRLGFKSSRELADSYPLVPIHRKAVDLIVIEIGNGRIGFNTGAEDRLGVRGPNFGTSFGVPAPSTAPGSTPTTPQGSAAGSSIGSGPGVPKSVSVPNLSAPPPAAPVPRKLVATTVNDPRTVKRELKGFTPKGSERVKLATLVQELKDIKLEKTPHAFCFVLRTVFELSAKAYCNDNPGAGIALANAQGEQRKLKDILTEILEHLVTDPVTGKKVQLKQRQLHGAATEIKDADSLLSVTSMNQLVHGQTFLVSTQHICTVFVKVLPLLKAMNS